MISSTIPGERIRKRNARPVVEGDYVLYWMQQSQRTEENHALEFAIEQANRLGLPVITCFGLTGGYPEANLRHYAFMIDGLRDVEGSLKKRGIRFVVRHGDPAETALRLGKRAALIVCDRGYLRHQEEWRRQVAEEAGCAVFRVESDLIVPVGTASGKQEYAARTFRPKITGLVDRFLSPPPALEPVRRSDENEIEGLDVGDDEALFGPLAVDTGVRPVPLFTGGTTAAKNVLADFIRHRLNGYAAHRNQPQTDYVSHMSKYLHFGQISPCHIARRIRESRTGTAEDRDTYRDELIVRRELTFNFVHHHDAYDRFDGMPAWARRTLAAHGDDDRPYRYTLARFENAETHDPYWNAAMEEMKTTGYMHNYMRMYWGKKILEWADTPENAYRIALLLNNKYFIDGRDPNSYANIGWIFGLHDRPWQEREIYGKVRLMTAGGLERKTDPAAYIAKVDRLRQAVASR